MATRKPITVVSGLFQEVNTPTDKLDFAGNTTADLSENTNLYYTNARARAAVSVTDDGGDGSLAYNSTTGVITYTGPSAAEVRAHISVASGSGLTYSSGEIGTNAIPNAQLANSSITIGTTAVALGASQTNFAGIATIATTTSVTSDVIEADSYVRVGTDGQAGGVRLDRLGGGAVTFEGTTANNFETDLRVTDPTADRTITFPDATGTVALTSDIAVTASSTTTFSNKSISLGSNTVTGTTAQFNTALSDGSFTTIAGTETLTNKTLTTPILDGPTLKATSATVAGKILFKEGTDNGTNTVTLLGPAATADVTLTLPAETGTVLSTASSIANSNLANSSVTIGSTAVALGASTASLAGVTSITSAAVVTDDDGFRVRDNSDATKQLAFECSGITGSTTRTMTIPDADGTIATQAYVNAQITAEDLDIETDSGTIDIDLNSDVLDIAGGTNITTSASGTTVTINMPTAFATEGFATAIAVALG